MYPHTQTTIDRALASGVKITDDHVRASNTLRAAALDYVETYKGFNSFVQSLAVQLADRGTLSVPQMRGALNVMVAEARPSKREIINAAHDKSMFTVPDGFHPQRGRSKKSVEQRKRWQQAQADIDELFPE